MPPRPQTDRLFFTRCGLLMLGCIVLGFGGRALTQREENAPDLWILLPHIACIGGWYVLFTVQAWLMGSGRQRARRHRLHRRLGRASVLLVVGLLVTGVLITGANFRLKGDAPLVFFNLLNLSQFALLYTWAVLQVQERALHKRLMLFGSIAMLPPALVRIIQAVGLPEPVTVALMLAWWVPPVVHDRRTLGRVHRGTWIGIGVIAFGLVVGGPVGFSEGWRELVVGWFGEPVVAGGSG